MIPEHSPGLKAPAMLISETEDAVLKAGEADIILEQQVLVQCACGDDIRHIGKEEMGWTVMPPDSS